MSFDTPTIMKSLSPKIFNKAIQTFDKATTIVVGACWGAAILMMVFAVYTMTLSISAKTERDETLIAEPVLPKIVRKNIDMRVAQKMVERLQTRNPGILFSLQSNQMTISAADGGKFRDWLAALSYVDTISPEYHWTIQEFCVGKCKSGEIMRAVLKGENVSLEVPKTETK